VSKRRGLASKRLLPGTAAQLSLHRCLWCPRLPRPKVLLACPAGGCAEGRFHVELRADPDTRGRAATAVAKPQLGTGAQLLGGAALLSVLRPTLQPRPATQLRLLSSLCLLLAPARQRSGPAGASCGSEAVQPAAATVGVAVLHTREEGSDAFRAAARCVGASLLLGRL
jgi:hypothetical protein